MTSKWSRLPRIPEDINADWLNANVGWHVQPGTPISSSVLSHSHEMGSVYRISDGQNRIVIKTTPVSDDPIGRLVGSSQLLWREVQMYDLLRRAGSPVDAIAPRCRWYRADANGNGAFALDDVATVDRSVGAVMTGALSEREISAALKALALVHAKFAVRAGAGQPLAAPWLFRPDSVQMMEWFALGFDDLPRMLSPSLSTRGKASKAQQISQLDVSVYSHDSVLVAICQGDLWPGNVLFRRAPKQAESEVAFVDWQFATLGNPLTDVASLLMTTLGPQQRRGMEQRLLRVYFDELHRHLDFGYAFEECMRDYERAKPYGAMIVLCALDSYMTPMDASQKRVFQTNVEDLLNVYLESPQLLREHGRAGLAMSPVSPATI